ncbi:CDP-glycerol--poly(glycerophosphate) glycerophosphotransferase [Neobacillus vireti]|uniref:CDP-glycerol:poly(Glycerophosphate) glycerophosphotransferase n=1 Tax=Neobacillus vireti LMG 21834 TaxID=1131730 RepID=A0AB94IQ14_9BACI|nr:CDP-glycerol--poly(glycerophosphate) glycerophosphotransferase [Neobacillus vireti]ETI69156.1 CDP-glycerol:poly(glycerophosphate) glycerophosphotransferase [Neobacillus vireti LMG 21834]KLT15536.1 teichoic acid biosynthesis protein B [Neobacillus vireti]
MLREAAISCYLLLFKLFFTIFKIFPQQKKVTFVISFEENAIYLYRELRKQDPSLKLAFLCKSSVSGEFKNELKDTKIIPFETKNILNWFVSLFHLSTGRFVIVDNYFGFLAAVTFKKNVECIQIWHAAGALKTFGMQDRSIRYRSDSAKRRFQEVYDKFHKIVVGSDEMASIFREAFHVPSQRMLPTGFPRTDFFYDKEARDAVVTSFYENYPMLAGKKLILYAPTYRDGQLKNSEFHLDIKQMQQKLGSSYFLLIKLHPAVKTKTNYQELYPDFVGDFSSYKRINELLVVTDYLITDYSSLPFEYSLLKKPIIFFSYDLAEYREQRGLVKDYERIVPGPIVFNTDEMIELIEADSFDEQAIKEFSSRWNRYSNGQSAKKLVEYILNQINS